MTKTPAPDHLFPAPPTTTEHPPGRSAARATRSAPRMPRQPRELLEAALSGKPVVYGLHRLVDSVQPAVVFTALARLLVPQLSDSCEVVIIEQGTPGYRIAFPHRSTHGSAPSDTQPSATADHHVLSTPIVGISGIGRTYVGTMVCRWDRARAPDPTEAAAAEVAVDYAVAVIDYARLNSALDDAEAEAVNLKVALASSREIGIAVGVLMGRNLITREVAFDLLRTVSHDHKLRLGDIAAHIVGSDDLPGSTQLRPAQE